MEIVCWLNKSGKIADELQSGEVFVVPSGCNVQWRISQSSQIAKSAVLVLNGAKIQFEKGTKGYLFKNSMLDQAGILKFCLEIDDPATGCKLQTEKQRILVQPIMSLGKTFIQVYDIRLQTNLSRCLGKLEDWIKVLEPQIECGFNFFHLTSVNQLGKFGSLYCIGDYSQLNNEFFTDNNMNEDEKFRKLEETVKNIQEIGAGVLVDLVLSHCSSLNSIFSISPDAAYNLQNTPHLNAAYELDSALSSLSKDMEKSRLKYKCRNRIEKIEDLSYIMTVIKEIVHDLKLPEFFCIDTEEVLKQFTECLDRIESLEQNEEFVKFLQKHGLRQFIRKKMLVKQGWGRFKCEILTDTLWITCLNIGMTNEVILREGIKEIQSLNASQVSKANRKIQKALQNIEAEIRYQKIELRVFEVTENKPLVKPYFTNLPNGQPVLLNGFIYSTQKHFKEDISEKWNYLERNIITWRDCVKLNYGKDLSCCSKWIHVLQTHVTQFARIFSGFRLDNCHGTPLWVTKSLIKLGRKVNPNLLILAEFFSNSSEIDSKYVSQIGINLLLRESLTQPSLSSLSSALLNDRAVLSLRSKIPTILYDFTHDNPTVPQITRIESALDNLVSVQCKLGAIGSTRGYDEVIPVQLSVVEEKRLYIQHPKRVNLTPSYKVLGVKLGVKVHVEFIGDASSVEIFGDWDGWKTGLSLRGQGGVWRCFLEFPESQIGMNYGFKFCIDGKKWVCDERQRFYRTWDGFLNNLVRVERNLVGLGRVCEGLMDIRERMRVLREIWKEFGYSEMEVKEWDGKVLGVFMGNRESRAGYWVFTRAGFRVDGRCRVNTELKGVCEKVEICCKLEVSGSHVEELENITGIPVQLKSIEFKNFGKITPRPEGDLLEILDFSIGTVLILKTKTICEDLYIKLNKQLDLLSDPKRNKHLFEYLTIEDYNLLLWRTKEQESGLYEFPNAPHLKFAGIAGLVCALQGVKTLEPLSPIYQNLYNGNWYMDYCIKRLERMSSDVLCFFLQEVFEIIKQLPRAHIPEALIRTLRTVFKTCKQSLVLYQIQCPQIPKSFLFYFTQIWTQTNIKVLCSIWEYFPSTLRFEHLWAVDLLLALNLFETAEKSLNQAALSLKAHKTATVSVHFLHAVSLFIRKTDLRAFEIDIEGQSLLEHCIENFQFIVEMTLDVESGLVLAQIGESWCRSTTRSGAFIELTALLFEVLDFFSSVSTFQQEYVHKTATLNISEWKRLVKKAVEELYFIPTDRNSCYIKPELIGTDGIFKDTLGCKDEKSEYKCTVNCMMALGIAPAMFDRDLAKKCWKKCFGVLGGSQWVRASEDSVGSERWIWVQYYVFKSGMELGAVESSKRWEFVNEIKENMKKDWFGVLDRTQNGFYSGLSYWAIIKTLTLLNDN